MRKYFIEHYWMNPAKFQRGSIEYWWQLVLFDKDNKGAEYSKGNNLGQIKNILVEAMYDFNK